MAKTREEDYDCYGCRLSRFSLISRMSLSPGDNKGSVPGPEYFLLYWYLITQSSTEFSKG